MKVIAKCHNYTGCVRAYKGENIELDSAAALVCPECGKPVVVGKSGTGWMKATLILSLGVILVGAGTFFVLSKMDKLGGGKRGSAVASPTPKKGDGKTTTTPPGNDSDVKPAEPPATVVAPEKIELDVNRAENKSVKLEVLTRIDLMPTISQTNKDKLYTSVERARKMGKVVTVPFGSGGSAISPSDVDLIRASLTSQEVTKLRDDPTAVFVILGYADSKGDDKKNIAISQARADSVLNVMKTKCGIQNVMHAVAMGSSKLQDAQHLEKNRIVEVWAVLP